MRIIILGGGQVGTSVAINLVNEVNDITVVDTNADVLQPLSERYDLSTVTGVASHPEVLEQAGGAYADMIIAVTNNDETNMIACQVAYTFFHTPTKIARIRNVGYLNKAGLFTQDALPIDVIISPEQIVTEHIQRLVNYPGTLQVLNFADHKAQMVTLRVLKNGVLEGCKINDLAQQLSGLYFRVVLIFRHGNLLMPVGDTVIEEDDELSFIASSKHMRKILVAVGNKEKAVSNIIIAGGGNIGGCLAAALEKQYPQVKLIEKNLECAKRASHLLSKTVVLHGDTSDEELLHSEDIGRTDIFCALTNSDEANIISSILAKRLGAKKAISLINRMGYLDLIKSDSIDVVISPQRLTIGSLLTYVRRGDVAAVHALRHGTAEAIELVAHGYRDTSRIVGRMISEIDLPKGVMIGAVVHEGEVLMAHDNTRIEENDHVILFLYDKKVVPQVENLFKVGITFL